jgi:hypothetical protein
MLFIKEEYNPSLLFGFIFFEFIIHSVTVSRYDKIKIYKDTIYVRSPYRLNHREKTICLDKINRVIQFSVPYSPLFYRFMFNDNSWVDIYINHKPHGEIFKKWIKYLFDNGINIYRNNGRFNAPTKNWNTVI